MHAAFEHLATAERGYEGETMATETKATHTPGPWEVQAGTDAYTHIVRACAGRLIASTPQENNEQNIANARLIAAAPELLGTLKFVTAELNSVWKHIGQTNGNAIALQAEVLIAKAEGK